MEVVVAIDKRKQVSGIKYRARYKGASATFSRKTDADTWETYQKLEQERAKYLPEKLKIVRSANFCNRGGQKTGQ